MKKTIFRLLLYFFSRFIKTDKLADKFPVSVKAIIIDNNRVLCLKNEREEWDLPGGKVDFNEDIEKCLKREVKEEVNLEIKNLNILKPLNLKFNNVYVLVLVYLADISCEYPINISYEHSEYNFFSGAEIKNLNIPQNYKDLIKNLI